MNSTGKRTAGGSGERHSVCGESLEACQCLGLHLPNDKTVRTQYEFQYDDIFHICSVSHVQQKKKKRKQNDKKEEQYIKATDARGKVMEGI
jgi:hypothetical protein